MRIGDVLSVAVLSNLLPLRMYHTSCQGAALVTYRASEGSLRFNVDFSPMASPAFEGGRPGEAVVEATRLLERAFRNAGAVDLEALCVVAGVKARQQPRGARLHMRSMKHAWAPCTAECMLA